MGAIGKILHYIFGELVYCKHGLTANDGVCALCCNGDLGDWDYEDELDDELFEEV